MGVPTIVLPMWVDLYDYATRTEWLGVGFWGSRTAAPFWEAGELGDAFMRLLDGSDEARRIAARAKEVGELVRARGGRHTAAQAIVNYANGKDVRVERGGPGETTEREL
jgi:UDP:flavonoid glycosyltransferase YjiC (YdhE family)